MAYHQLDCRIVGVSPFLSHNGRLSDAEDPITIEIAKIGNGKRVSAENIARRNSLYWIGSLYTNTDNRVIVPGYCFEAMLAKSAGSLEKNGLKDRFKAGVFVMDDPLLIYSGPQDIETLSKDPRFYDRRMVRTKIGNKVATVRAIFSEWSVKFSISFDGNVVNGSKVIEVLENAGMYTAIGSYRPKFGRFYVDYANAEDGYVETKAEPKKTRPKKVEITA